MRSFLISMLLLAGMLCGIVTNYIYINEVSDEMNTRLDALPDLFDPSCVARLTSLSSYWDKQVDRVGLSVCYATRDRVSEQIATLQACAACGDIFGYQTALALLRDAIGDMKRLEDFEIGNLL